MARTITDLAGWYKFNGNYNDTFAGNNGSDTDITYATGKLSQAAVFNGSRHCL